MDDNRLRKYFGDYKNLNTPKKRAKVMKKGAVKKRELEKCDRELSKAINLNIEDTVNSIKKRNKSEYIRVIPFDAVYYV